MTWLLVWQNKDMKERFWFVYYWLMIGYLLLFLYILISNTLNVKDSNYGEKSWVSNSLVVDLRRSIYFDFLGFIIFRCEWLGQDKYTYGENEVIPYHVADKIKRCTGGNVEVLRDINIRNYLPLFIVFLMTLIRYIFIGKHIWQRP